MKNTGQKKRKKPKGNGFVLFNGYFFGMREGIQAYRWAGPLLFHNQRLKLVKTIFFDAFDISNRREISGRHGVALAWNYLYPPIPIVVVVAVVVESSLLLQYFFLWSEQQNKRRVCRLCTICTEKERGGGPDLVVRSSCIPPTHLCPIQNKKQQQQQQ